MTNKHKTDTKFTFTAFLGSIMQMKLKNICLVIILLITVASRVPVLSIEPDNFTIDELIQITSSKPYQNLYDKLIPYFLVYDAKINSQPLRFIRLGSDKGAFYVVPKYALRNADALIGYGIQKDILFEEEFSKLYDKNSYGYDCGVDSVPIHNKKCHFESECIGTDKCILKAEGQKSSLRIHSFGQNLSKLGLQDKKVFVKMDISGAELDVMDDILKYSNNITGLALVIHCYTAAQIIPTINMLNEIDKNFILVSRNTHPTNARCYSKFKCSKGRGYYSSVMSLSYINKNLVDEYKIAKTQDSSKQQWQGEHKDQIPTDIIKWKVLPDIMIKNLHSKKRK